MSRRTGIPVSTLHERIMAQHYIKKFTIIPDFSAFGYDTKIHALLAVRSEDKDAVRAYLGDHPHINNLYRINNGYDFLFEALFANLTQVEAFFEDLEKNYKIKTKVIHYILEDINQEAFLARPHHAEWAYGREAGRAKLNP